MKSVRPGRGRKGGSKKVLGRKDSDEPDLDEVDDDIAEEMPALRSVVKVFTTHSDPDFTLPWQKQPQYRSNGTGFVISGRTKEEMFVLTNAHCVEHFTQVQLKRRGDDAKFTAKVLAIGWECDLALLEVQDEAFYEGDLEAVPFAKKLPRLEDPVMCAGYPVGGETMSVTSGVVSRIEVTEYTQCKTELLGIQIDAAINSGNSGGPALNQAGECVGVAFQTLDASEAENIGYVIPNAVIMHFLRDVEMTGQYRGFPSLGLSVQNMENKTLREAHKMQARERGVLVRNVSNTSCSAGKVQAGDVLLSFNGQPIGYDGTVPLRSHERVSYKWQVAQQFVGDKVQLAILRDGEHQTVELELSTHHMLVPNHLPAGRQKPSYFIVGGIVLTNVSTGYLRDEHGDDWKKEAPLGLAYLAVAGKSERRTEELVVIAQILAHDITTGYEEMEHGVVEKVNGEKIESLADALTKVKSHTGEYIRFDLRDHHGVIIIPVRAAEEALPGLLEEHCIASSISDDLAALHAPPPSHGKD